MQDINKSPYDVKKKLLVSLSGHGLNNEPSNEQTILYHSNIELVCQSDPNYIPVFNLYK